MRPYDSNKCMSIYADTEVKNRTLVQKLQDQLYEALKADGEDIGYGLIAATPADMMLVLKLDRVSQTIKTHHKIFPRVLEIVIATDSHLHPEPYCYGKLSKCTIVS